MQEDNIDTEQLYGMLISESESDVKLGVEILNVCSSSKRSDIINRLREAKIKVPMYFFTSSIYISDSVAPREMEIELWDVVDEFPASPYKCLRWYYNRNINIKI